MPVDPREISLPAEGPPIADDRACAVCNYNLKGLRVGGRCPECGQPIRAVVPGGRESLTDAPIAYLKSLRFGFGLMFWGFVGETLGLLFAGLAGGANFQILAIVSTLAWWLGVYIVTEPRRRQGVPAALAAKEHKHLRLVIRLTQGGWTASLALRLMVAHGFLSGGLAVWAGWVAWAALLIATASLVPLLILLMDFAHWSSNTELAERLRLAAWGLGSFGMLVMGSPRLIEAIQNAPGIVALPLVILKLLMPILFFLFLLIEIVFLVCLYQLWNSATWAVRNWAEARAVERRQVERAERIANEPEPPSPPTVPPPPGTRFGPGPMADPSPIERLGSTGPAEIEPYELEP